MKLYLVQHAQPNAVEIDPEKGLSQKGRDDAKKLADFLKRAGVVVEQVCHSGKARAEQTAVILARSVNPKKEVYKISGIEPMDPVDGVLQELKSAEEDLMLVGHLPFLNVLAAALLGVHGNGEIIQFRQGGAVCLEKVEQYWRVCWMVVPDLL